MFTKKKCPGNYDIKVDELTVLTDIPEQNNGQSTGKQTKQNKN